MSWGERSCLKTGECTIATMSTCNVDCPHYVWDGATKPDSESVSVRTELELKQSPFEEWKRRHYSRNRKVT